MAKSQSSKGNPAHTRMSNENLKARRGRSWLRNRQRGHARNAEQVAAARRNRELRRQGKPVPWEIAKLERRIRRETARAGAPRPGGQS
jgi:hypothetical protein